MPLPGMLLNRVSVFDLKPGQKVYDKDTDKLGVISDIKETAPEYIEAFVMFEGETLETPAWKLRNCVIL